VSKSTRSHRSRKSKCKKPYKDFPLTAHPSGRWVKKCRKKAFYFGPIGEGAEYEPNWRAALDQFNREWQYILKGEPIPGQEPENQDNPPCTLRELCNEFLATKRNKIESGELSERSYRDYFRTCKLLIDHFGKERAIESLKPLDFEAFRKSLAKKLNPATLGNEITRCRVVFKFAADADLIDKPVKFGQSFDRPSKTSDLAQSSDWRNRRQCLEELADGFRNRSSSASRAWSSSRIPPGKLITRHPRRHCNDQNHPSINRWP